MKTVKRFLSMLLTVAMILPLLPVIELPAFAVETESVIEQDDSWIFERTNYTMTIIKDGFRYGFQKPDGTEIVSEHSTSGICYGPAGGESCPVVSSSYEGMVGNTATFKVVNSQNLAAKVTVTFFDRYVNIQIEESEYQAKEGNALVFTSSGERVHRLVDAIDVPDLYTVESMVKLPSDAASSNSVGIIAQAQSYNTYVLLYVKPGKIGLGRWVNGTKKTSIAEVSVDTVVDEWYKLKLVVDGGKLQGYLGDELIFDIEDTSVDATYMSGTAGMRCYGNKVFYYDDFKVNSNDGATVYYSNDFEDETSETIKSDFEFPKDTTKFFMTIGEGQGTLNEVESQIEESSSLVFTSSGERVHRLVDTIEVPDYCTVESMVKLPSDAASSNSVGIIAQAQSYNTYVLLYIKPGKIGLGRWVNGSKKTSIAEVAVDTVVDEWYKLKLVVDGSKLQGYLGDELIFDVEDTSVDATYMTGTAGMRCYGNKDFYYDDFKVISNDGTTVYYSNDFEDETSETIKSDFEFPKDTSLFFLSINEVSDKRVIDARVGPVEYMYGLGDHGAMDNTEWFIVRDSSNVVGIDRVAEGKFSNNGSIGRFISNFSIAPDRGFAQVLFEDSDKRVSITDEQTMLGVCSTTKIDGLYYFFGEPEEIYADYKAVRNSEGYLDSQPHYEMFGVGWEAYGALGWDAYQSSIQSIITDYLNNGYHLSWGVFGSGFWVGDRKGLEGSTTSFGMWDDTEDPDGREDGLPNPRVPDPEGLKKFFEDNDMKLLLGIRTHLKLPAEYGGAWDASVDGEFVLEALEKGYLQTDEDGNLITLNANYPSGGMSKLKVALIDSSNEEAVKWYVEKAGLWGVDGFKEDTMLQSNAHNDNSWNSILSELSEGKDQLVIVRNAAYSVPGDILRIDDANYGTTDKWDRSADRIILNCLAYAASGQSNVYPDIVGGAFAGSKIGDANFQTYLVRNAYVDALCPSMSIGINVNEMNNETNEAAVLKALNWHATYAPYIYDAALKTYNTGYPVSMTPLYIAYPQDENTYHMIDTTNRMYEWMLGESILATPLFGNDVETATTRDIYLPEGTWIQYDTGEVFVAGSEGLLLEDREIPIDTMPCFVGGKGVLIGEDLKNKGNYFAEVFPVAEKGSVYTYTFTDAETVSTFTNVNDGWSPLSIEIWDTTTNEKVDFNYNSVNGSFKFVFTAGHNYELRGGTPVGGVISASLTVENNEFWVEEGSKTTVTAQRDDNATADMSTATVVYISSDPTVATVDESGVITGVSAGTVEICAQVTADGYMVSTNPVKITVVPSKVAISNAINITDDFSSGLDLWYDHANGFAVNDGKLQCTDTSTAARPAITIGNVGSDCVMEVDITLPSIVGDSSVGFVTRYHDSQNHYLLLYTPMYGVRILKRVSDTVTVLAKNSNVKLEAGETYTFRADVSGNHYKLYIDDALVLYATENGEASLTAGLSGLYSWHIDAVMDNFSVDTRASQFPFTICGTASSGRTVQLSISNQIVTADVDRSTGAWSYTLDSMENGSYDLKAELLNSSGQVVAECLGLLTVTDAPDDSGITMPDESEGETEIINFDESTDAEKFDFFHSSAGGFAVQDGLLLPTGDEGEFKAIYKDSGYKYSMVSVDIYPDATTGMNGGLYINATDPDDPLDQINSLYVGIESITEDTNRMDVIIGSFPAWTELKRVISEGEGAFLSNGREPVNLKVVISDNTLTVTVSLVSDSSKILSTSYTYQGAGTLMLGDVGVRSATGAASYDNFSVKYTEVQQTDSEATTNHVTFDIDSDINNFDCYHSSNGGFVIEDDKLVPAGDSGEFKAIYQGYGAAIHSASVEIYPSGTNDFVGGLYFNSNKIGHAIDEIEGICVFIESNDSVDTGRMDIVVGTFPNWNQLHRVVYEGEASLFTDGIKEPVQLSVDVSGNTLTITLCLISDSSKAVSTTYTYQGAGDLSRGDVGIRSFFSDASFDNFVVTQSGGYVASVGAVMYYTLADAVEAANGGLVKMLNNTAEEVNITNDLTIDLNGNNISNIVVLEGVTVNLIDTATDDFDGEYGTASGSINGTIENFITYDGKTYLVVAENGVYSAHCYDVAITHISLNPAKDALGYKAQVYGDEIVQAHVKSLGFNLWVDGGQTKTYEKAASNITLRLQNILKCGGGEMNINATAFVTLAVGEETHTETGTQQTTTMKETLQKVNAAWADYTEAQQTAVKALCDLYLDTVSGWELTNIYPTEEDAA